MQGTRTVVFLGRRAQATLTLAHRRCVRHGVPRFKQVLYPFCRLVHGLRSAIRERSTRSPSPLRCTYTALLKLRTELLKQKLFDAQQHLLAIRS